MSGGIWYDLGSVALPIASVICGLILWKATPQPNSLFGYRTRRSLQSGSAWIFAQKTAGRLFVTVYSAMIPFSLAAAILSDIYFDSDGRYWTLMGIVAFQIAVMVLINLRIERRLKTVFDEDGNLRG